MQQDTITVKEAAKRLGIGINQAYSACERGQIPTVRFGRRWIIPKKAFENWLNFLTPEEQKQGASDETTR